MRKSSHKHLFDRRDLRSRKNHKIKTNLHQSILLLSIIRAETLLGEKSKQEWTSAKNLFDTIHLWADFGIDNMKTISDNLIPIPEYSNLTYM